jgi:NitT/TauT family transport system permease protein
MTAPKLAFARALVRTEGEEKPTPQRLMLRLLHNRSAMMLCSPAIALSIWQLLVYCGLISTESFTSPAQVFTALGEVVFEKNAALRGSLATHVWASLQEVLLGFLLAVVIGVPVGMFMGWSRIAFNFLDPLVELLRPIPPTAWVAISLLIFGLGLQQKVFVVFVGVISPILITTLDGVRGIDPILLKVARTHNASPTDTLRKVVFPALLPNILTSFRVGIGMGWMVVVAAELIAAEAGLGFLLIQAYRIFRMDVMIAVMLIIGLLALLMDRGMRWVQNRLMMWQEPIR